MAGLVGDLGIRVSDGINDKIVTKRSRGLKFTKVAPGGHQSLSFSMFLPRGTFTDLGPADRAYVYDGRTGRTIIEGYLENPTPVDGPDGQQYDISAVGGMALLNDESHALIYVTRNLDWELAGNYSSGSMGTNGAGIRIQFTSGNTVPNSAFIAALCGEFNRAGMNLGAFTVEDYSGVIDTNYQLGAFMGGGSAIIGDTTPRLTTAHVVDTKWVGTHFAAGTTLTIYIQRIGAGSSTVSNDTTWSQLDNFCAIGQRMIRTGALLTGPTGLVSATQVWAYQVVEDLVGRVMTFVDPNAAQIDTTTFGITQLSYPDGVKAASVLSDLAVYEPGFLYEVLETNATGKHQFNYRAWPTTPRYTVSVKDGWQERGSDIDLCNRILVSWTDAAGKPQVTEVTAASLGLTGIGLPVDALGTRVKDADPVTLPEGQGSAANATQVGGQILADKINPPKAGSVVVRRPITDQITGNRAMPWEIEPGYICRVRELGYDLRITQVDYDDDTCSAVLTLGSPVLTTEQRLARLDRVA